MKNLNVKHVLTLSILLFLFNRCGSCWTGNLLLDRCLHSVQILEGGIIEHEQCRHAINTYFEWNFPPIQQATASRHKLHLKSMDIIVLRSKTCWMLSTSIYSKRTISIFIILKWFVASLLFWKCWETKMSGIHLSIPFHWYDSTTYIKSYYNWNSQHGIQYV